MRINFLTLRYPPAAGGVEKYVMDCAAAARSLGYETSVETSDLADHLTAQRLPQEQLSDLTRPETSEVNRHRSFYSPGLRGYPIVPAMGARRLLRAPAAITHAHGLYYFPFDIAVAAGSQPLVLNPHAYIRQGRKWEIYRRVIARCMRRADRIVAVSGYERDMLLQEFRLPTEKVTTIPPLIDSDGSAMELEQHRILKFVSVGRLDTGKGHYKLLEAAKRLANGSREYELVILGSSSSDRDRIMTLAGALRSRVRVVPDATREQIAAEVRSADCFISASSYEAFGIAAVEAAASGCYVVGFDTGALPTVIGMSDGTFVENQSYESLLVAALDRGREEPVTRDNRARSYTERYGWSAWKEAWGELYGGIG